MINADETRRYPCQSFGVDRPFGRGAAGGEIRGDSKIGNPNNSAVVDEDVSWRDVCVYNAASVQVVQRARSLL